ncbi:hypothetical protein I316_01898 [Kwoniella heveanensis BCC8398]|uniref:Zn(2)-C6 fungal-type domain-containing protein n=1 Tax=Kwoniella heveanensis BCC8398 TaxID=1296120 RepID=A0A1B9H053_9TREE|nr:hypothetical protein I316_01898 [Kwoniella heveanensis BCC8398]
MDPDSPDVSNDDGDTDSRSNKAVKREDGKGGGSGSGDGKGEKKGGINRVNRACNNCRRMKMRCVGAEDPPCKRCKNGGLECVMEKPGRSTVGGEAHIGEDRIRSLESQVSSIQNTLVDLVTTLKAGMSSSASNTSGHTPHGHTTGTPEYTSAASSMPHPHAGINNLIGSPTINAFGMDPHNPQSRGLARPSLYTGPQTSSFLAHQITQTYPPHGNAGMPPPHGGQGPRRPMIMDEQSRRQSMPANLQSYLSPWPPGHRTDGLEHQRETQHMSLPPSRAGSVGPEDILGPEEIINPLGQMSNMAGLVEAAVERAREEQAKASSQNGASPTKRSGSELEKSTVDESVKPSKKARFTSPQPPATGQVVYENQNLPPRAIVPGHKPQPMKPHIHNFPDAVTEGFVSETEGRELMNVFYSGSSNFIPCFDPNNDTWDSLRVRSPFAITSIIFVGARVRDGGGPQSDVQRLCRQHAERVATHSLFHPVGQRIEAVQSMILLAAFRDNGWLPGGHAVRMAVDMGINRSFLVLLRTGMGKGKSKEELEEERSLVVQSRVWLCLYLMEHQMAYGTGRPAIIREDETIHQCRRLLEHPMSITSDARLVSTVELTALRSPLHIELTTAPDLPIAENTLKRLKQANADFDAWERYWDRILSDRFSKGKGDFYRESLIIQRQYAELFVNSQLLRGIRDPADIVNMPEEKRTLAIRAMRNAQKCLEICLRGENYRNGLRYAVHYTHVCAAFAASFLIRIARLFPGELNLKKTAKDVEELALVLSSIPAGRYARSLRLILRKARRQKLIPAASRMPSPNKGPSALPSIPGTAPASAPPSGPTISQTSSTSGVDPMVAFSPSQLVNAAFYPTPSPAPIAGPGSAPATTGPGSVPPLNHVSPSTAMLLNATQHIMNDSPSSAEFFEFDSLFAQETMERAGIQLGEDNQLPLFLDGQSLGSSVNTMDMAPYVGLEQFFLPQDIDNRLTLTGPNGFGGAAGPGGGGGGDGLNGTNGSVSGSGSAGPSGGADGGYGLGDGHGSWW